VDVHPAPAGGGHDWPIIALVASAGGLDALEQILGALPKTLDASVVVLLHQAPDRDSRLVELLGRRSILPVDEARDGVALRPGRVTVVPPGSHLLIGRGLRTTLIDSGASPPNRPSGDLLLATLATAAGARVLAVILSGGGHDGAPARPRFGRSAAPWWPPIKRRRSRSRCRTRRSGAASSTTWCRWRESLICCGA
jgi:chemotaxis response regulator CheB